MHLERRPDSRQITAMSSKNPPELDMTIEGNFVAPDKQPFINRVMVWAIIIAVVAGAVCIAAFALAVALWLLPVALGAGVVAYAMVQYRIWRARKAFGRQQGVWRP